jgi:hypothetical protein
VFFIDLTPAPFLNCLGGEISLGAYKDVRYNLRKTLRFPTPFLFCDPDVNLLGLLVALYKPAQYCNRAAPKQTASAIIMPSTTPSPSINKLNTNAMPHISLMAEP